jgi:hypothetical protein
MDGAVIDNLGLMYVINAYRRGIIRERIASGAIKHLVIIIVDAGNKPPEAIERSPSSPGILRSGYQAASASVQAGSETLTEAMRYLMQEEPARTRKLINHYTKVIRQIDPNVALPDPPAHLKIDRYLVVLGDDEMSEADRQRFSAMPTSLFLPADDVDFLTQLGRRLVINNKEIQKLRENIGSPKSNPQTQVK